MKNLSDRLDERLEMKMGLELDLKLFTRLGLRLGIKLQQAPQTYSNPVCASPTKFTCNALMLDVAAKTSKEALLKAPRFN